MRLKHRATRHALWQLLELALLGAWVPAACHGVTKVEHRRGATPVAGAPAESGAGSEAGDGSLGGSVGNASGGGGDGGTNDGGSAGAPCVPMEPCVPELSCWQGETDCSSGEPICNLDEPTPLRFGTSCGEGLECNGAGECLEAHPPCPSSTSGTLGCGLLAVGSEHVCALLTEGRVKCWGSNSNGQVGHGDNSTPSTTNRGDEAGEMGDALPFVDLGTDERAIQVVAGSFFSCALLESGAVKCWGENANGELGAGDTVQRGDDPGEMGDPLPYVRLPPGRIAITISGAADHVCALLDNKQISCWGENLSAQLGTGDLLPLGNTDADLPTVDLGSHTAKMVSAGGGHTCVVLDDDSLSCWGRNAYGALGIGSTETLGDSPSEMGEGLTILALGADRLAKSVFAGGGQTCVILDNDALKCWGYNHWGFLGLGNKWTFGEEPTDLLANLSGIPLGSGPEQYAKAIAAGSSQAICVILADGLIKCWGRNNVGQLGLEDLLNRGDGSGEMGDALPNVVLGSPNPGVKAMAMAWDTTCALLESDEIKCWGGNVSGQLGRGDTFPIGGVDGQMATLDPVDLGTE